MALAKYENFLSFCRMASNQLTHVSLASTHRTSIAFFLLFIAIFVVPFLSLSTSELIPSTLPTVAYTLWNSLLAILTSSPFYFFLLNFLIVALVVSSGVLDPSSPGREFDGLQEGDLYQRSLHNYSTAAQIIHERLALDELYESQASSLPYLNITERSPIYVAGDEMIANGYGDEGEVYNDKGKQIMTNPIDSFLHQRPAFSNADGGDALDVEGSSRGRMEMSEEVLLTGSMVGDELDMKKISSVVMKSEIVDMHGVCKDIHGKNLHTESNVDADADANANAHLEHNKDSTDVINNDHMDDHMGGNDVIHEEDGNDVMHDESGDDHVDDRNVHNDQECDGIEAEAEADGDGKRRQRIASTRSQPINAGTIHSLQRENVGAEMSEEMGGVSSSEGIHEEKQKEEAMMMSMSTQELNERASAFISAFRKKLVSTAIDDVSGQM